MISLWDVAPDDKKDAETGALDQDWQMKRVASAYGALFSGTGSKEDADIVLVDIAQFTRYYDTAQLSMEPATAQALAHRRAVLSRVLEAMVLSGKEPDGLMQAVARTPPLEERNS
jgi:hypothetical protein